MMTKPLQGLQQLFEENRESLLRYLRAHGAGDAAEDLLQELWLKVASYAGGPIASPRNYLFRAATNLMIDHRRAEFQGRRREDEWSGLADRLGNSVANDPGPERGAGRATQAGDRRARAAEASATGAGNFSRASHRGPDPARNRCAIRASAQVRSRVICDRPIGCSTRFGGGSMRNSAIVSVLRGMRWE